jgi:tight adherence protein C
MEILVTALLFATLAGLMTVVGVRLWARPKAVLDRVTQTELSNRQAVRHPSLAFRDLLKRLGTMLPTSPKDVTVMQRRLIRAGFRGPGALRTFYGAKVVLGALFPLVATVAVAGADLSAERKGMFVLLCLAAGFFAPNEYVRIRVRRRQKAIHKGLPNGLDLLVVCVESGLGLDQAMMQVAKDLERAHPEISQEFGLVNLELRAGKRRAESLRNMADRSGVDDLRKLVAVLIQADRFGTGVAQSLRTHSDYMRVQARQRAEEKAAKLGVKLVFPIFFCILPSLFVVTVGPVIVRIIRELLPMMQNM